MADDVHLTKPGESVTVIHGSADADVSTPYPPLSAVAMVLAKLAQENGGRYPKPYGDPIVGGPTE